MKNVKKIAAVVLALVMALSMSLVAFAAGEGSITIENAVTGQDYTIYRIFDLDSHNTDYSGVVYKVNAKWADFFKEGAKGLNYVKIENGEVVWLEGASVADFAAAAFEFASANSVENDGSKKASSTELKFENLDLGYYLVQSNLSGLCSLDTTTPNAVMKEKNSKPSLDKQVQENSTGDYGKTNDANVGETVNFKVTVSALDGSPKNYVIHDKMSEGLTFGSVISVTLNNTALTAGTDYTVSTETTDGCTFEISFKDGVVTPGDVIVADYDAVLNDKAVVGSTGNPNESWLEYGDLTKLTTEPSVTRTYTWSFDVFKYTGDKEALAGAQFVLYRFNNDIKEYAVADSNNKLTGWTQSLEEATVFTSPASGRFTISGLDSGRYFLSEVKAPDGYNKLKEDVEIALNGQINEEAPFDSKTIVNDIENGLVEVQNNKGSELPETGGIGTTIFYIAGGLIVAAAIILLITKKRMSKVKD